MNFSKKLRTIQAMFCLNKNGLSKMKSVQIKSIVLAIFILFPVASMAAGDAWVLPEFSEDEELQAFLAADGDPMPTGSQGNETDLNLADGATLLSNIGLDELPADFDSGSLVVPLDPSQGSQFDEPGFPSVPMAARTPEAEPTPQKPASQKPRNVRSAAPSPDVLAHDDDDDDGDDASINSAVEVESDEEPTGLACEQERCQALLRERSRLFQLLEFPQILYANVSNDEQGLRQLNAWLENMIQKLNRLVQERERYNRLMVERSQLSAPPLLPAQMCSDIYSQSCVYNHDVALHRFNNWVELENAAAKAALSDANRQSEQASVRQRRPEKPAQSRKRKPETSHEDDTLEFLIQ